jgi:hypothetical protein
MPRENPVPPTNVNVQTHTMPITSAVTRMVGYQKTLVLTFTDGSVARLAYIDGA